MKKKIINCLMALILTVSCITPAYAGTWEKKTYDNGNYGWKYKQDNGTYVAKGWKQIDGDWYYFGLNNVTYRNRMIYTDNGGLHKYGAPVYYVGSDSRMITQGGFYNDSYGKSTFLDSTGKVVAGFFMVDDVLYYTNFDNGDGYTIHSINTTYRNDDKRTTFQCADGKERTLHYIYDGGKVLELDGNPIKSDDKFYQLIKYIPKYNSQGVLVGEIRN